MNNNYMNIPFKVRLLTPTAKAPEKPDEASLWDLFADSFSTQELQDFSSSGEDSFTSLNKLLTYELAESQYITTFDGGKKGLDDDLKVFRRFGLEIYEDSEQRDCVGFELYPQGRVLVRTGISLELPIAFGAPQGSWYFKEEQEKTRALNAIDVYAVADIYPREELALKHGIAILNSPNTVDSSYKNELCIVLLNAGHEPYVVCKGSKVARMLIRPHYRSSFQIVTDPRNSQTS
jgi:dUTPase